MTSTTAAANADQANAVAAANNNTNTNNITDVNAMSDDILAGVLAGHESGFADAILYGPGAGWSAEPVVQHAGHELLLEKLIRAKRYQNNEEDSADVTGQTENTNNIKKEEGLLVADSLSELQQSPELKELLREARQTYTKAEKMLASGLTSCEDWMGLRDIFYKAGTLFSVAGLPDDAAKCLLHATFINRAFHDDDEAVVSLNLSVENLKLAHPRIAVSALVRLAGCYDKAELHFQAARCRREAGEMYETRLDDKSSAIAQYTAAMETYAKTNKYNMHRSLSDACAERLCVLHVEETNYKVAQELFLRHARSIPRPLPRTRHFLCATLCELATGFGSDDKFFDAIYDTKKLLDALQEEDAGYQSGSEKDLMCKLLHAFDTNSLNEYDLAVMEYKTLKTTLPGLVRDLLLERCRMNLFEHIERFA